ncbi:uncharacterized protein MELLADRAFT_123561 [Melampsora larici-populina 98AG31]|uniref:Secreted protein n=1 Tax=Melampsora larici-populina (strain 98AG31 / pathotype 3-4-7) TaxID=747676 RepID=F4RU46_MELLP|nr:uncharacterized protein MELLADRAFT_123561 [Melampsora larici-populina 98AG31]EGG04111.1 secreted protein [Melampsora larici-populina 98AG31]
MTALIKTLFLIAALTYGVASTTVAAPSCQAYHSVDAGECRSALASYQTDNEGLIIQNQTSSQKSCFGCLIKFETSLGDNLRFSAEGAEEALVLIMNECNEGYGSVTIPELLVPGRRIVPTVLSVEEGSGEICN